MAITTGGGPWESNKEHFAERHCVSECAKGGTQGTRQWLCVARQTNEVIKWKRRTPAHTRTFHFLCCCFDIKRRDEKWMRGKMEWIAGGILFGKEGNLKEKRERERKKEQQTLYVFLASERGTKLFFSFLLQQVSLLIKATLFPSLPIHLPFSLSLSSSQWLMSCFQSSNRGEQVVDPFGLFGLEYRAIQTNLSLSLSLLLPFSSACCRLFFFLFRGTAVSWKCWESPESKEDDTH